MKYGYIQKKNPTDLSGFYVVYYGSTLNETKGTYGISHLMEHLMCHSFDDLQLEFDKDGISWNAYTANEHIVFFMTGLDKYVKKWKKTFYERLLKFEITQEKLDNEKKIVYEEYLDSFNGQLESHYSNLQRKIFNHYNPIGLGEDIQNVTLDICKDFFEKYLSKPHKIVDISNKPDKKSKKMFEKISYCDIEVKKDIEYLNGENFIFEKRNEFKNKTSCIFLSPIIKDDFVYIDFICKMLNDGLKSPLYDEVREKKGLVYYLWCYVDRFNYDNCIINISTETSNENIKILHDTIEEVLKNPDKYLTKDRFDIIKTKYQIEFQKSKINRYKNAGKFISPKKWNLSENIEDLTYENVMSKYNQYFNFDVFYKSYDSEEFKDNKELTTEDVLEMTR